MTSSKSVDANQHKYSTVKLLQSYKTWPDLAEQTPSCLAASFFEYTTYKDSVICPCCQFEKGDWKRSDKPLEVHRTQSPGCPLVQRDIEEDYLQEFDGPEIDGVEEEFVEERYGEVDLTQSEQLAKEARAKERLKILGDLPALKKENEQIQSQLTCRNCKKTEVQTLFLPCRHLVSCEECGDAVDYCFLCSTKIMGTVRTYLI